MNWNSLGDFLAMGGYGLYVWGSFGMTALVLLVECGSLAMRRKALREMPLDESEDFQERPLHEA